jgi:diguanylate cyclase (GGDEF)-like protein
VAQGETIGLLCLVPVAGAVPASVAEVAEMLGLRLANLRLRDVLRTQAIRDPLTGLFNRRYLEETLSREAARAGRNQSPLALMVFDVDHFKRFNDSHGHAGGDVMLQQVGSVLARSFRDSDVVCRFGGEEFVVIAPDCAADCAVARAETVLREMREQTVVIDGKQVAGATISAGVAVMPDHGTDPDVVFRAADAALYQSKASGRDRVTLASVAGVGTRSGTGARIEH